MAYGAFVAWPIFNNADPKVVDCAKNSTFLMLFSGSVAVAVTLMGSPTMKMEAGDGLVMLTVGLPLTVMLMMAEERTPPSLSVARALKVYEPEERLLTTEDTGDTEGLRTEDSRFVPWKNSIFAIVPSLSEAVAVSVTLLPGG